jgi:hypothetical protein
MADMHYTGSVALRYTARLVGTRHSLNMRLA